MTDPANFYLRPCRHCGHFVRIARAEDGTWQPFAIDGDGRHDCDAPAGVDRGWNLHDLGHPLTAQIDCWWCDETVYLHTDGSGNFVLFDALGWPWSAHGCWGENTHERDAVVDRFDKWLRTRGYQGESHYVGLRPDAVPNTIRARARSNPPSLRIRLEAPDHSIVDDAAKKLVDAVQNSPSRRRVVAVPLPVRSTALEDGFVEHQHRRAVDVWNAKPKLVQRLAKVQLPNGVDVSIQQAKGRSL
jgi:ribosomal protein S10